MQVLLYSYVFWPSLGGIEIVTDVLAQNLVKLGHKCTVVTETALGDRSELERPYRIVRRPRWRERFALARQSTIVHANGASIAMYAYARWAGVPFVWTHNGYQVSCVDGLGWAYGKAAPMSPLASIRFHAREMGWRFASVAALKLGLRRWVAQRVDLNFAGSEWVARRQPLPNQHVTYNPYPLERFKAAPEVTECRHDFLYVGRLVSEKGVDVLVRAFGLLLRDPNNAAIRMGIAGGGDMRPALQALAIEVGAADQIDFLGPLRGDEVVHAMSRARCGIVPSTWEEPYGGVTLEWLTAGKRVIVSESGGHAECAGHAGLQFKNGDFQALSATMRSVLTDQSSSTRLRERAIARAEEFDEARLTEIYLRCYELALERRGARSSFGRNWGVRPLP